MLTSFDHVTIVVRDLPAAQTAYTRMLGIAPTWSGKHAGLGTCVALFAFENTMLELVGPDGDALEASGLRALLEARGEGLQTLAFGTDDAAACSKSLRERGLRATPPEAGVAVSVDGATRSYRTVELSPRDTRGLSVLAVQREDRARLRLRQAPAPACAHALDHVVLRTSDPDAAIALYEKALGVRLALDKTFGDTRMLFFRIGGVTLEVVHDPTLGPHDTFYGLAYRVRDLEAAATRLRDSGCSISDVRNGVKPGTRVLTVRDGTSGVPTLLLWDPSRDVARRSDGR